MDKRVDNIPTILKPIFLPYAYVVGGLHWLYIWLAHLTCRIEIRGREHLEKTPHHILCLWHYEWWSCFCAFGRSPYKVYLNHPLRYMKPIHIMLHLFGARRLILIAPGKGARDALSKMVEILKSGESTWISPDGPSGPPKKLKKGVYYLARDSGVPILPVRFVSHRHFIFPSWDAKQVPLPFSKITVEYSSPVVVGNGCFEEVEQQLLKQM